MTTSWNRANTDWLHDAKWGTFTHFLADTASATHATELTPDDWNRRIDSVDVDLLAQQIADTGSGYHMMTLGQNSGFFCSPNSTYDTIVGGPSRLSERDLLSDLADALGSRGVRTFAYLPSHAPALYRQAVEALKFTPKWDMSGTGIAPGTYLAAADIDARLTEALRNWEAVVSEWSTRWGSRVHGWWIDGCYYADKLYRHADAPNFCSFAEALKAGNPDSLVAFNSGVSTVFTCTSEFDDYTAGELDKLVTDTRDKTQSRFVDGAQLQVLSYLGHWWGDLSPRFPDELVVGYTKHIIEHGGVVTWDIPITTDGKLTPPFLDQLSKIGASL